MFFQIWIILRSVHPTGSYADLFADFYGITVEDCLAQGMGVQTEIDSGDADDRMP